MVQYSDDGGSAPPRSDAERLQAALEALAARDQVLADRTRRLNALEATAARLVALTARLEAAEEQLAALQRVRLAEVGERDARLSRLEGATAESLAGPAAEPATARPAHRTAPADAAPDAPALAGRIAGLEQELHLERQRNLRLGEREHQAAVGENARLQGALDAARREAAALQGQVADLQRRLGDTAPGGAYARWEESFQRRLAQRHDGDLQRAEERIARQQSALEEKERLIALLIGRLQAAGEVREGPDDLKRITGIGPVIEDLLHALGIETFEQVAALTDEEIDRIGERLGVFRERIRRDGWTQQAAELAQRRVRLGPGLSLD